MKNEITDDQLIISYLITNKKYFDKVYPHIKNEYFDNDISRKIFDIIKKYSTKYNEVPSYTIIKNILSSDKLQETERVLFLDVITHIENIKENNDVSYMIDMTEKFCKNRALYNSIMKAYNIYDGTDKKSPVNVIPEIIKDAISISFDTSMGHNYDDDAKVRWDYYTSPKTKIPFEFPTMNNVTGGGVTRKTLNLVAAGVNVGKTLMLVVLASMYKRLGYDVLYITNEVSELEVGKRIDAGMFGIDTDRLIELGELKYLETVANIKEKSGGKLIIKEYATHTCSKNEIEALLQDLELRQGFKPDIIINDYLTINASASMPRSANMYQYYNSIAEEMRAVAQKYDCVMWSASQLKTDAMHASDVSLSQLSDSQGIARTADLVWCVVRQEELDRLKEILFIQLKTRYHSVKHVKWSMGIDIAKHRIIDKMKPIDGIEPVDMSMLLDYKNAVNDNNESLKVENKTDKQTNGIDFGDCDDDDMFEAFVV